MTTWIPSIVKSWVRLCSHHPRCVRPCENIIADVQYRSCISCHVQLLAGILGREGTCWPLPPRFPTAFLWDHDNSKPKTSINAATEKQFTRSISSLLSTIKKKLSHQQIHSLWFLLLNPVISRLDEFHGEVFYILAGHFCRRLLQKWVFHAPYQQSRHNYFASKCSVNYTHNIIKHKDRFNSQL